MAARSTIRVGLLHSLSGTMAADEKHLAAVAEMAVDEINEAGGVLGTQVEVVLGDGASDPCVFADKARELLAQEEVQTIFGCWTSSSRKAVKPIVEERNSLLWYPIQYEGLEQSANILYTGSCLNQQIEPAVTWALSQGRRRCFLVGSDYVFPRTANSLIRALASQGGGCVLGERYVPLGSHDLAGVAGAIAKARPDIVFNTINGDSNFTFFREFSRAVGDAGDCPIMSFSFAEISSREVPRESAGHYACWSYFQCLQTPENACFLKKYGRRFGADAVVYDPIATAYTQVYLWKQAVEKARSFDVFEILNHVAGCSVVGPGGVMEMQTNHHVKKLALIGQATPQGRFDVVWSSEHPINPKPWLGVEDAELPTRGLVLEALRQYPEVIHLNVELDRRVRQRTAELERANEALKAEIAERKRAEEALRESEATNRAILEAFPDLMFRLSRDGEHMDFHAPNSKDLYVAPESIVGRTVGDLLPTELAQKYLEHIERTFENHAMEIFEYQLEFQEEDRRSFEARMVLCGEDSVLTTVRDITERKRAEAEREHLIAKLEAQNAELERFAYTVSHDLKSPLITINGYVGMLDEDLAEGDSGAVKDDLTRISNAAAKMDQLLKDVLELSRIGRLVNPPEDVPLQELAREALELVGGQVKERGVQVEIAPGLPVVFGDRLRLREVLQNLIANAVKYMGDRSEPRVEIGSRRDGDETICYVRDNGIGIERRYHERVFGLFDQLDPKVEGSGIGLALVKRIVEVHGGRIWMESEGSGHGSTFCFTIPTRSESTRRPGG